MELLELTSNSLVMIAMKYYNKYFAQSKKKEPACNHCIFSSKPFNKFRIHVKKSLIILSYSDHVTDAIGKECDLVFKNTDSGIKRPEP